MTKTANTNAIPAGAGHSKTGKPKTDHGEQAHVELELEINIKRKKPDETPPATGK